MKEKKVTVKGVSESEVKDVVEKLKKSGASKVVAMRSTFINLDPERNLLVFEMTPEELERGMTGLTSHKEGGTCTKEMFGYIKELLAKYVKDDDKESDKLITHVTMLMAAASLATDIEVAIKEADVKLNEYEKEAFESAEPINNLMA